MLRRWAAMLSAIEVIAPPKRRQAAQVRRGRTPATETTWKAKYLASEYGKEVVEDSFRIHGGYGFSKEYEIERLHREAPMLLIGDGTAEIQKMIVGRRLLEEYQVTG
jgi:alkylation response protein AidB-like acyl-CoA dehydrogenase